MNRLTEAWFEFGGRNSTEFGILMREMPVRQQPALRGKAVTVSGAHGTRWQSDGGYDTIDVSVEFVAADASRIKDINAWLTGFGALRFSDEPDVAYDARIVKAYKRQSVTPRLDGQVYSITFSCQPFKRLIPAAEPITITASGTTIPNPGTAPSQPRVTIAGSGNFSVTIGMETLFFADVSGGIIVDSELMDAFTADGKLLYNDHMEGEPWQIMPGDNVVSWETEDGSRVDSVTILPRWRCI